MDSSIGLPIGIGCAFLFAGILFWYTYRNQVEPEGGRGTEEQLSAQYSAQIRREIELEQKGGEKDSNDIEESLKTQTLTV